MFSWLLFNCLIIATASGSLRILCFALVINIVAWLEHKMRQEHYENENRVLVSNVKRLTTRKYKKDIKLS